MRCICSVLLALLSIACSPDRREQLGDTADPTVTPPPYSIETLPPESIAPTQPVPRLPPRPATRADTIFIEGTPEVVTLTLVRSPEWFRPPFSTYVPPRMRTDFVADDATPSVRFAAAFDGSVSPDAYLQVRLYPPGAAELVAQQEVDAYLRGRSPRQDPITQSDRWPWALDSYGFAYGGEGGTQRFVGAMAIARHGNRFLHVLTHYPAEYGDGMGPRVAQILDEWRWEDDGSFLTAH